ncbi:twin-arginine translocase TatA/TatE family subunit [Hwanghaeella grinnelliae]|uniref:Sec-independent protein translocase protein TatA n=1 Tax=Hwanghaeella grinnelliae TaxID=2500179 RepID=A0A3S2Y5T7_9PROT|nr:twin-arginine translocase TatA/TatE family subunit [Hwanghaeella grinnelliae]RVU39228.1 twin-arginine translocase TatA/TatE family subunit [Hwanghaeella grinnelliae]
MGAFSIWHWLIVLAVVLLLFGGRGKISQLMGDFGKGLNAFKKNVKDQADDDTAEGESKQLKSDANAESSDEKVKDKAANG